MKWGACLSLVVGSGSLGGCGFQPVYGTNTRSGSDTTEDLAKVWVDAGSERNGQILYNFLRDRLNPHGLSPQPTMVLTTQLSVREQGVGARLDSSTSRARIIALARSTLRDRESGESWDFETQSVVGFSTTRDIYAADVAEDSATEQALRAVADDLRLQLITFFEKRRLVGQ